MQSGADWTELKNYIEKMTGEKIRHRKIKAIGVNPHFHGQPKKLIEVGQYYSDLEPGAAQEEVIAIFEGRLVFSVCTVERGGDLKSLPYLFRRDSVYQVKLT